MDLSVDTILDILKVPVHVEFKDLVLLLKRILAPEGQAVAGLVVLTVLFELCVADILADEVIIVRTCVALVLTVENDEALDDVEPFFVAEASLLVEVFEAGEAFEVDAAFEVWEAFVLGAASVLEGFIVESGCFVLVFTTLLLFEPAFSGPKARHFEKRSHDFSCNIRQNMFCQRWTRITYI